MQQSNRPPFFELSVIQTIRHIDFVKRVHHAHHLAVSGVPRVNSR